MVAHLGIVSLAVWALFQHTTSACRVSCSNDYISSLNCTCLEEVPSYPFAFVAECWDEIEKTNSSCSVTAPSRWCTLELDSEFVIGADIQCKIRAASQEGDWATEEHHSTLISLMNHIKPRPPFNLTLTQNSQNFTVFWEMVYTSDTYYYLNNQLMYRVRIRAKNSSHKDLSKVVTIREDRRYLEVIKGTLQRGETYVVDVQARPDFHYFATGYWSEWSSAVELQVEGKSPHHPNTGTEKTKVVDEPIRSTVMLSVDKMAWLYKINVHIPSPEDYFKPLYGIYGGDFTKWVGPAFVFGERDFLEKNMVLPVVNGKPVNPLPKCEPESKDSGAGCALKNSLLGIMSGESSSGGQATQSSRGRISIDTVMVLEEAGTGPKGCFDSYRGIFAYPAYRLGENLGCEGKALLGAESKKEAVISSGRVSDGDGVPRGLSAPLGLYDLEWGLSDGASELERLSLDSFGSGERSEDGYPNVVLDLDTIDSGFLESDCGSPVRSEFGDKEETEVPHQHSNYVKQWVTTSSEAGAQAVPAS
ncbi:interleukin-21 receptor-like [Arapaima gigas]